MLHVLKFSNGLYKKHPTGYTKDLNEAAVYTDIVEALGVARSLLANPQMANNLQIAGCAYKLIEVKLVEI